MDVLKKHLENLGFTADEVKVYLSALEEGVSTPLSIARNTGIPRTTVYLLIESLLQKNVLVLSGDSSKKSYTPQAPEELLRLAQKRRSELQETVLALRHELPQLQALYNHTLGDPRIQYASGEEEVVKLLNQMVSGEKILIQRSLHKDRTRFTFSFEKLMNTWEQEMIPIQELIFGETHSFKEYVSVYGSSRHEIQCLAGVPSTQISQLVIGDSIVYVLARLDRSLAIAVHDSSISHFEYIRFISLWRAASTILTDR